MSTSLAFIVPDDGAPEIDFDLVLSESHTNASTVTDHPVEQGVNVADHVKPDPIELTLDVWITNTLDQSDPKYGGAVLPVQLTLPPLPPPPPTLDLFTLIKNAISPPLPPPPLVIQTLAFPVPFDRITDSHNSLTKLERSGGTSTVITSTKTYINMVLIKVSYDKTEAGAATFTLGFKQVLIVSSSTVTAPKPVEPRGASKQAKGSQSTQPTDATRRSLAKKAFNAAAATLGG